MAMQTHFRRLKAPFNSRFATKIESVVYQAMPDDRLVTAEDVWVRITPACKREGVTRPTKAGLAQVLANLAERGFAREYHGVKLERLLAASP